MNDVINELIDLKTKYPDLKIFCFVNSAVFVEDGFYSQGIMHRVEICDYLEKEGRVIIKKYADDWEIIEFIDGKGAADNYEYEQMIKELKKVVWQKGIFIFIEEPD